MRRGWKVKIRDKERNEPPHATILHKKRAWRIGLRSSQFLDAQPDPKHVPQEILSEIEDNLELLRSQWDEMYPENPVESKEGDDDG